jgi:hypothetical protein
MENPGDRIDANLIQLIIGLQMAAMQQMGKIASPLSGKVERNLDMAKSSIDLLSMLAEKTRNNLTKEEDGFLQRVLYELRMNFVDESGKPQNDTGKEKEGKGSESPLKPESAEQDAPEKPESGEKAEE